MKLIESALLTMVVYGFAGWVYIAANAVVHPQSLAWPLTHLLPWPREDTFGIICFGLSSISFFIYTYIRKSK